MCLDLKGRQKTFTHLSNCQDTASNAQPLGYKLAMLHAVNDKTNTLDKECISISYWCRLGIHEGVFCPCHLPYFT